MGAAGSFLGKKDPIRDIISKLTRYAGSRLDCIHLLETLYRVLQPRVGSGDAAQEHFMSRKGPQVLVECINCWKEDEVVVRYVVCLLAQNMVRLLRCASGGLQQDVFATCPRHDPSGNAAARTRCGWRSPERSSSARWAY